MKQIRFLPILAWACLLGGANQIQAQERVPGLFGDHVEFMFHNALGMKMTVYTEDQIPSEPKDRDRVAVTVYSGCKAGTLAAFLTLVGLPPCQISWYSYPEYLKRKAAQKDTAHATEKNIASGNKDSLSSPTIASVQRSPAGSIVGTANSP